MLEDALQQAAALKRQREEVEATLLKVDEAFHVTGGMERDAYDRLK